MVYLIAFYFRLNLFNSTECDLQIGEVNIKQVSNFKYLGSVLADEANKTPQSEDTFKSQTIAL